MKEPVLMHESGAADEDIEIAQFRSMQPFIGKP